MIYSVKDLSRIAGVSTRTLHFYDEIGLLKPSFIKENGYRCYEDAELLKLQQILFFRELEFSLEKIKEIVNSPKYNPLEALLDQQKLLELKKKKAERLLKTIKQTINSLKGGEEMKNDDKFSAFNDPTYQKHKAEVEQRWGNTDAYKESREKVAKMSKQDLERVKKEQEEISAGAAELMQQGFSVDSPEVQAKVDMFFKHLHNFYTPSMEMFKGLGEMYVSDPRFTEVYEKRAKGFAIFMRDAMAYYADKNSGA